MLKQFSRSSDQERHPTQATMDGCKGPAEQSTLLRHSKLPNDVHSGCLKTEPARPGSKKYQNVLQTPSMGSQHAAGRARSGDVRHGQGTFEWVERLRRSSSASARTALEFEVVRIPSGVIPRPGYPKPSRSYSTFGQVSKSQLEPVQTGRQRRPQLQSQQEGHPRLVPQSCLTSASTSACQGRIGEDGKREALSLNSHGSASCRGRVLRSRPGENVAELLPRFLQLLATRCYAQVRHGLFEAGDRHDPC